MLKGYLDKVTAIAFLPDGKVLALVLDNNAVKLWDASMGVV